MRKLTRKELRALVLEAKKSGFKLEDTIVLLDTFKRGDWYGLGMNFMDGKKSMRVVMPLKNKASLDVICKQLGRIYKEIKISEAPTVDYTNDGPQWMDEGVC